MITPNQYDIQEEEAIKRYPELYEDQKWTVKEDKDWKSHVDFPLSIQDFSELGCLLNRFQRGRFDGYMAELDGLTEEEIHQFKVALHKIEILGSRYLKDYEYPLDQLLASLAIHRKIRMAKQGPISILEVGPGSGLTTLFFAQDKNITKYTQIETTQSLYLLQELVNEVSGLSVEHLTWWSKIPEDKYDVITANAVLAELTDNGLSRYLNMFNEIAHDKTLLLVQCPGGHVHREDEDVLRALTKAGWHLQKTSFMGVVSPLITWWFTKYPGFTFATDVDYPNRQILTKEYFMKVRTF